MVDGSIVTSIIYNNLDEGKVTVGIFIDPTKAFDMVNHSQLLAVLQDLRFKGKVNTLMSSYLTNSTFPLTMKLLMNKW